MQAPAPYLDSSNNSILLSSDNTLSASAGRKLLGRKLIDTTDYVRTYKLSLPAICALPCGAQIFCAEADAI